jgi:hypothetical protein
MADAIHAELGEVLSDARPERQHRSDDRSIDASFPIALLIAISHTVAALTTISFASSRSARAQHRRDQTGPPIRPQQDVRVDQQPHGPYSKYSCSSGGRGVSKSSAL